MVFKKKPKRTIEEEYGPEEGYEEDDEEEVEEEEAPEYKGKKSKKKQRYEVVYQQERLGIVDTTTKEPVVVKVNSKYEENDINEMILEAKKLNDIEDIKKVVM